MDSDEVRKRKEYAERKVKERHAALRKEAEERRKHTVEHRERVQSQLKREQVLLQKHMQKLNEDEERKAATLAKQHEATSRMAAISRSPNKSFAFGSSTPRTLAYLDNLPKSEQQYDKKLRPLEGGSPSPVSTSPNTKPYRLPSTPQRAPPAAHRPAPAMTSMTSSMYVTSSAPPTRHLKAKPPQITSRATSSTTRNSMMTQSVYTPSRPVTATTTSSLNSRITKKTPIRPTTSSSGGAGRRSMDVRKPPMPRKSMPAEVKKIAEESPREVPEVVVVPEVAPEVVEAAPEVILAPEAAPVTQEAPEPAPEVVENSPESAPEAEKQSEEIQEAPKVILAPEVAPEAPEAPEVVENAPEPTPEVELIQIDDKAQEQVQDAPELTAEHTDEQKIIVPEAQEAPAAQVAPEAPAAPEEEQTHQDAPEEQQVASPTPEPTQLDAPEELLIPTTPEVVEVAPEVAHHEEETLISLTNEDTGSTANNSLADELMEIRKTPEVEELHYPMPDEKHNDLVDVFGNDFINGARQPLPPAIQQHVEFDEDTDSGKASPTSSETSSTTDEVTPREEVKAVRVMPIVRSAEDIAKKEREAAEQEERKARLAAILAKSRGMASPLTNTLPPTAATISDSTPATIATNATTTIPPPTTSPMAEATTSGEESAEKEAGGASDVLARLAAKTNLPSLQKILQRKQGSNPSLQTTESTGGEIY